MNYILKITPARRANDTNENRAEWPQRIVILITTGGLFSRWMCVTWRDVIQSGLALSSGRLSNVQRRATALSALAFWNANFTPMPGYLPCFAINARCPARARTHLFNGYDWARETTSYPFSARYRFQRKSLIFFWKEFRELRREKLAMGSRSRWLCGLSQIWR